MLLQHVPAPFAPSARKHTQAQNTTHSHRRDGRRLILQEASIALIGLKVHLEIVQSFTLAKVRIGVRTQDPWKSSDSVCSSVHPSAWLLRHETCCCVAASTHAGRGLLTNALGLETADDGLGETVVLVEGDHGFHLDLLSTCDEENDIVSECGEHGWRGNAQVKSGLKTESISYVVAPLYP